MQDLATHPLMTKAREGYIESCVTTACEDAGERLGNREFGDFIYNRAGRIVRREALEGAAYDFDRVVKEFVDLGKDFIAGTSTFNGYIYHDQLEWVIDKYEAISDEEQEIINIIYGVIDQIKSIQKEAA